MKLKARFSQNPRAPWSPGISDSLWLSLPSFAEQTFYFSTRLLNGPSFWVWLTKLIDKLLRYSKRNFDTQLQGDRLFKSFWGKIFWENPLAILEINLFSDYFPLCLHPSCSKDSFQVNSCHSSHSKDIKAKRFLFDKNEKEDVFVEAIRRRIAFWWLSWTWNNAITSWRSIYDSIMSVNDSALISKFAGTFDVIKDSFIGVMNRWITRGTAIWLKLSELVASTITIKAFIEQKAANERLLKSASGLSKQLFLCLWLCGSFMHKLSLCHEAIVTANRLPFFTIQINEHKSSQ